MWEPFYNNLFKVKEYTEFLHGSVICNKGRLYLVACIGTTFTNTFI